MQSKLSRTRDWVRFAVSQGVWFHGGNIELTAAAWERTGMTIEEAAEYIDAGVFDELACKEVLDMGVDPEDLRIITEDGVTLGHAWANGDIASIAELNWKIVNLG